MLDRQAGPLKLEGNTDKLSLDYAALNAEGPGASATFAIPGKPYPRLMLGAMVRVHEEASSDDGGTTGLTLAAGWAGSTTELVNTTAVFGFGEGDNPLTIGDGLGGLVPADTDLVVTVAATGGSADLADIDAGAWTLKLRLDPI